MNINKILENIENSYSGDNLEIKSIAYDSRKILNESLFVAIEGLEFDGHDYILDAVDKGALAIIASKSGINDILIPIIQVKDTRKALSQLAANFYDQPSKKINTIGVTGTNGKTTTCYIINSIFNSNGLNSGSIGTLGFMSSSNIINTGYTTPESLELHGFLDNLVKCGIDNVVMEASSHALAQHRLDDVEINTAVYTNLSQDHLDFHHDMESYFSEKLKLFSSLKSSSSAVINIDDKYSTKIIDNTSAGIYTYGFNTSADIYPVNVSYSYNSIDATLSIFNNRYRVKSHLSGKHNLYNIMAGIHVALINKLPIDDVIKSICEIEFIPGRMEYIGNSQYKIYVDYAHTPDAFENILSMIREIKHNGDKIITLFGCGGNRDQTKRPIMSRIAEKYSDLLIITSDNPRDEPLNDIINHMVSGLQLQNHQIIQDRKEAIIHAISIMDDNTILLILGKGREDYQVVNGVKNLHSDTDIVQGAINAN